MAWKLVAALQLLLKTNKIMQNNMMTLWLTLTSNDTHGRPAYKPQYIGSILIIARLVSWAYWLPMALYDVRRIQAFCYF